VTVEIGIDHDLKHESSSEVLSNKQLA